MNSILYRKRPTAAQMYLDPRTKILLCFIVTFVTLVNGDNLFVPYLRICVAIVPMLFLLILKKYKLVMYYVVMYAVALTIPYWIMPYLPPVANLLFTGMIAVSTQAIPSMSMFCFVVMTTTVSEFMAAMDKLRIPKSISVPVSTMFRFFPTIKEEYGAIRDAMRMRKVGTPRKPVEMLEYRMVPLLMSVLSIANELSASALTRGLDAPVRRVNVCPIGFHWQDFVAFVFGISVIGVYVIAELLGM